VSLDYFISLVPDIIVEELIEDMEEDHDNNENITTVREASIMA